MSEPKPKTRLTAGQREEARRRALAGENQRQLAAEFGCTRAYISLLKTEVEKPKPNRRNLTRKLTGTELTKLHEAIRQSTPFDLKLDPPLLRWDAGHVMQLAARWFDKKPSVRVIKESLACVPAPEIDPLYRKPQPPPKHHISQLSRELAEDKEFVKYYLSPLAERIAWRQYELALADWEARFGDAEVAYPKGYQPSDESDDGLHFTTTIQRPAERLPLPIPGQRTGKHAKGKSMPERKIRKARRR